MNEEDLEMRPTVLKRENIALREKLAAFQDIFEHLQARSEHVTNDSMKRLGAGDDPSDVLKTLRGELPRAVLSEQSAARAMLPPIHSDGELELLVRHPKAYYAIDLPVVAQETVSSLFRGGQSSYDHISHLGLVKTTANPSDHPRYCDSRLGKLNISFWTSVPVADDLAASAISLYIETHHPIWSFFDASKFIEDLIECRTDSTSTCSPLLVSSLLAFAMQGYSSIDTAASDYSYQFEEQAEKLFTAEGRQDSLPTIAALPLLYTSIATHGDVPRAVKYLTSANEAADRMNLFGDLDPDTLGSPSTIAASSQAAWGLFNFLVYSTSVDAKVYKDTPLGAHTTVTLLFAFAIEYTPAYWNLALSGAMVFTVNAVLNDLEDQERKNYLSFCISMSQRLLPSYVYMIETIRAILAIATDKGAISSADAIRMDAESALLQHAKYTDRSKGGWVVAPSADDNVGGNINTLTERFETITLFSEFTEGIA
ncbi:hypothetical protein E8E13_006783 [Curvularia kusanoi]|uniref:Uncharacterized protein n=1 Tax=Curvularia kusanoi TaxID=90978 RepID=A0A9P4TDB8_CURKU|nr:hypothetical protein E8E13_006783 [Curvularia kusanoi]